MDLSAVSFADWLAAIAAALSATTAWLSWRAGKRAASEQLRHQIASQGIQMIEQLKAMQPGQAEYQRLDQLEDSGALDPDEIDTWRRWYSDVHKILTETISIRDQIYEVKGDKKLNELRTALARLRIQMQAAPL